MKKKSKVPVSLDGAEEIDALAVPQDALQRAEWEEFVREAYLNLLDRPADPGGLDSYVNRLANGESKELILGRLEACPEGQRVALRRRCNERIYGDA